MRIQKGQCTNYFQFQPHSYNFKQPKSSKLAQFPLEFCRYDRVTTFMDSNLIPHDDKSGGLHCHHSAVENVTRLSWLDSSVPLTQSCSINTKTCRVYIYLNITDYKNLDVKSFQTRRRYNLAHTNPKELCVVLESANREYITNIIQLYKASQEQLLIRMITDTQ